MSATAEEALIEAMRASRKARFAPTTKAKPLTMKAAYVGAGDCVFLIGAYSGNIDDDRDRLEMPALVEMAHDFMKASSREINANHSSANKGKPIDCEVVESVTGSPILASGRTLRFGDVIPDDDEVVGINFKADPVAWVIGIQIHDPTILALARSGRIIGTSWEAWCERAPLESE